MKNKKILLKTGAGILGAGTLISLINLPLFITEKKSKVIVQDNTKSKTITPSIKSKQDLENQSEEAIRSIELQTAKIQNLEDENKRAKEIIRKKEKSLSNLKLQLEIFKKLKKYKFELEHLYEFRKTIFEISHSKWDYLQYLKVWEKLAKRNLTKKDIDTKVKKSYKKELKWIQDKIAYIKKSLKTKIN